MKKLTEMSTEQIIFRQIVTDVPDNWQPELRWQVEYHQPKKDYPFPMGLAWVMVPPHDQIPPFLEFVLVPDQFRRVGIATKLVRAIQARWPSVVLTDGISAAGEGLLRSLET